MRAVRLYAKGDLRVEDIAAASPRLEALILGVGDLSASQGIRTGHISDPALRYPGDMWHYARNRMIVAARANGLDAIDVGACKNLGCGLEAQKLNVSECFPFLNRRLTRHE